MGQTVKQAVAPAAAVVNKAVGGVIDITKGNVASGLKEVGGAYVDAGKAMYGITADNKSATKQLGEVAISEFRSNPAGFLASGAQAYATGGASLIPTAQASILSSLSASSPSQLASGGGSAPMLDAPQTPVYRSTGPADLTAPIAIGMAMVAAFVLIKRK